MPTSDSSSMILLDQFGSMLAKAETLDEVTEIRSRAEAVRNWARNVAINLEMQNRAAELKLRAERKAGQLLSDLKLRGGDRKSNGHNDRLKLCDLGISQSQSKRWQKEAAIPDAVFQQYICGTMEAGKEVTTAGLLRYLPHSARKPSVLTASLASRHRNASYADHRPLSGRPAVVVDDLTAEPTWRIDREASQPSLATEMIELVEEIQNHHAMLSGLLMPICNGEQESWLPGQRNGVRRYLLEVGRLLALVLARESPSREDRQGATQST